MVKIDNLESILENEQYRRLYLNSPYFNRSLKYLSEGVSEGILINTISILCETIIKQQEELIKCKMMMPSQTIINR